MLITKREGVTKQGFCKKSEENFVLRVVRLIRIYSLKWVGWRWALFSVWLGGGGGGRLFEAGRLSTFSAFKIGAYSRWVLIRGWVLIRINTVCRILYRTHRLLKRCGSSLDFEFIRECKKLNKIHPKFHFLTKIEIKMTYLVFSFCFLLSLCL